MKAAGAIILAMAVNTVSFVLTEAESPKVTGSWKVEITFANEQQRFLRYDAKRWKRHSDGGGPAIQSLGVLSLPRESGLATRETP